MFLLLTTLSGCKDQIWIGDTVNPNDVAIPRSFQTALYDTLSKDPNMLLLNELLFKRNYCMTGLCDGSLDPNLFDDEVDSLLLDFEENHQDEVQLIEDIGDLLDNAQIELYLDSVYNAMSAVVSLSANTIGDTTGLFVVFDSIFSSYLENETNGIILVRDPCQACRDAYELCKQNAGISTATNFAQNATLSLGAGVATSYLGGAGFVVAGIGLIGSAFAAGFEYAGSMYICNNNLSFCLQQNNCPGGGEGNQDCNAMKPIE